MKKQTSPPNRRGRLVLLCFVLGLILIVMLVGTVYLQHLLGRIHYVDSGTAPTLSPEELEALLRQAVEYCAENGMEIDFTSPGWLKEETLRALGLTLVPSCGACLSNMAVAPDGGVIPCQSWLSSQPLGNILADDWDKIWQSERCAAIRAKSAKMEQLCQLRQGNGEEASVC